MSQTAQKRYTKFSDLPKTYYGTLIVDFPWPEVGGGKIKRGADRHYPCMSLPQIFELCSEIKHITLPDAHLYLWVTNNYLEAGLQAVKLCGFKYVTMITWEKERMGLGQYFRGTTEHVLFARRGRPGYRVLSTGKRAQGKTSFSTEMEDDGDVEGVFLYGFSPDRVQAVFGRTPEEAVERYVKLNEARLTTRIHEIECGLLARLQRELEEVRSLATCKLEVQTLPDDWEPFEV